MSLTKAEIANRLFDEVGLNKREAKEFVDAYFETMNCVEVLSADQVLGVADDKDL